MRRLEDERVHGPLATKFSRNWVDEQEVQSESAKAIFEKEIADSGDENLLGLFKESSN